jgi:hypothetical protein
MKKAVIVAGGHHTGKSKTIRRHLKPLLGISCNAHKFMLRGKKGFILSQSFEESRRDVAATIKKYSHYDLLVLAARPQSESGSKLKSLRAALSKASFAVRIVTIRSRSEAPARAKEIFSILNSN